MFFFNSIATEMLLLLISGVDLLQSHLCCKGEMDAEESKRANETTKD